MAGAARYTALLDACVMFSAPMADLLMSLHVAGLYAARWTERIDGEWTRGVLRQKPDLSEKLGRRRDAMHSAVPDWEVPADAYEALMPGLRLPDADDIHVLAAAIAGHADCIVTSNLKHFPDAVLRQHQLEAIHPDDFVVFQFDLDPYPALAAVKQMRARLRNPPLSPEEFVAALERNQLTSTGQRLREAIELI
jgi:PIN domain